MKKQLKQYKETKMLNSKTERNVIKENLKQKSYEIKKDDLRKTLGNVVVNRVESSSCNDW